MCLNYQKVWVLYKQAKESTDRVEDEQPAWAPLRDNYMLTSSRLKDWDKMPVSILWSCITFMLHMYLALIIFHSYRIKMYQMTWEKLLKIVVQMKISILELEQAELRYSWWDNLSVFEYWYCSSCYWHRNILSIHFVAIGVPIRAMNHLQ